MRRENRPRSPFFTFEPPLGRGWVLATVALLALGGTPLAVAAEAEEPVRVIHAIQGPPVTPFVFDGDVRDLPVPRRWQPGDPIKMIPQRFYDEPATRSTFPAVHGLDSLLEIQQQDSSRLMLLNDAFTTPTRNFSGLGHYLASPPDPVGDVGPDHYIQMVNSGDGSLVRIFDKAEPVPNELATFHLDELTEERFCSDGMGDPIVLYDRGADRWLLSEMSRRVFHLCVYLSQTSDPVSGGWYAYEIDLTADYPKYSVWETDANGGAGSYIGVTIAEEVVALDRGAMLNGGPTSYQYFDSLSIVRLWGFAPAEPDGPLAPPPGSPAILMHPRDTEYYDGEQSAGDLMETWLLDVDWADPAESTLSFGPYFDIADYDTDLCGEERVCVPQPDSDVLLHTLREVLMHRLQYYNHGDFESLVGNYTVDVDGTDHSGIRWFELRREDGSDWSLHQEGTYAIDSDHRWMGSIAMDQAGNLALGHSISSTSTYPSLRYTGRLSDDPLGLMTQPETEIHAGLSSQAGPRWGDYQSMNLDPSDDCTFWFTGMDMTDDPYEWRTQIASFRFDLCGCETTLPSPSLEASVNAENRIDLFWEDSETEAVAEYTVRRSREPGGPYSTIAVVPDSSPGIAGGPGYTFEDTDVHGGITYYYAVLAGDGEHCRSLPDNEVSATATGSCTLPPVFDGLASALSGIHEICTVDLVWGAAVAECGGPVVYNVYRSDVPGFAPSSESLLVAGVTETFWPDHESLVDGTAHYYVVRAVDLANGAEEQNLVEREAIPVAPGAGVQTVFFEEFEDENSFNAWTVVNGSDHDCGDWRRSDDSMSEPTTSSGYYALSDSGECRGRNFQVDTALDSPVIDLGSPDIVSVTLELNLRRKCEEDDAATIEVWDGAEWRVVETLPEEDLQTGLSLDVTSYGAGNPDFRVRFRHRTANKGSWWSVDDVKVTAGTDAECTTAP